MVSQRLQAAWCHRGLLGRANKGVTLHCCCCRHSTAPPSMEAGKVPVMMVFYRVASEGEPMINRLAAWWQASDITHCEWYEPTKKLAAVIYQGERMGLYSKRFSNNGFRFRTLYVTPEQRDGMLAVARRAVGKPFNLIGLYRSATPFPRSCDDRSYFCSELATRILQGGGLLRNYDPGGVTPTMLYNMLASTTSVGMNPNMGSLLSGRAESGREKGRKKPGQGTEKESLLKRSASAPSRGKPKSYDRSRAFSLFP